jgi:5-formyltetrahydrofolate cyclo-ligase
MAASPDKIALRHALKHQRAVLDMPAQSQGITEQIRQSPVFQAARTVLAFYPMPDEVDLRPLMAASPEKTWALPRIGQPPDEDPTQLILHVYHPTDPLVPHRFGVLEPLPTAPRWPGAAVADLILLPGLAYDRQGYRIGYGKGFYDRLVASLPDDYPGTLAGVLPDALLVETLPIDPWDRPVHCLFTPTQTLCFQGRR